MSSTNDGLSRESSSAWQKLEPLLLPADLPLALSWEFGYRRLFDVAGSLNPHKMVEIGVRAGYSAFMLLQACPRATLLGFDNDSDAHGGRKGMVEYAKRIVPWDRFHVQICSSRDVSCLSSGVELLYIDGDHSIGGCLWDLVLGHSSAVRAILVDDVDNIPEVREALIIFQRLTMSEFSCEWHHENHGLAVLTRNT